MPRRKTLQTNFSAGELAPELAARSDTEQYQNGAKSLRNRRCLIGGGTVRRPGTFKQLEHLAAPRYAEFLFDQVTQYVIVFSDARFQVVRADGSVAATVTGCPWTAGMLAQLDYAQTGNLMFVTHSSMTPQVIVRASDTSWSRVPLAFFVSGPRVEQPYIKLAPDSFTLQPSALTGAITLTCNQPLYVAAHIGTIFRYLGRGILITGLLSSTVATGTVLEALPGTYTLTVNSSANFTVGEVVQGGSSGATGVISAIPDATHLTVYLRKPSTSTAGQSSIAAIGAIVGIGTGGLGEISLQPFSNEDIIGPFAKTTSTAVAAATNAAVVDWDEQLFSGARGFPSCVAIHRGRLCFSGHPSIPGALIGSQLRNFFSFDTGDGSDADAIFELLGDGLAAKIVQLFSAEQLLVATDRGMYYVPESAQAPFRPTSIAFFPFGSPWPINPQVKMRSFDNGVLAVSGSLVIKLRPTGDSSSAWNADEVSLLSPHLINNPVSMAVTTNLDGGPERHALFVNADGTMAVMQLVEAQKIRNFTPWDTNGLFLSVAVVTDKIFVATRRSISHTDRFFMERFDSAETLDLVSVFADEAALAGVPAAFGDLEVKVVTTTGFSLGPYPVVLDELPAGPFHVGIDYVSEIVTLPPVIDDSEGSHAGDLMRIAETLVFVHESYRFAQNGYELAPYQVTEPLDQPPPKRTGPQRFTNAGWRREPTITISQPDPLALKILAIKTKVIY